MYNVNTLSLTKCFKHLKTIITDNFAAMYVAAERSKQKSVKFKHNPWMSKGLRVSQKRKEKLFAKKSPKNTPKSTYP